MRVLHTLALAVPLLPAPGAPGNVRYKAWQWQRFIQPASAPSGGAQCVVLDGDLYAHAAPGLRDVRLLQDGREIAYALEESYDEDTLGGSRQLPGHADRSLYTTVLRIPLAMTGPVPPQRGEGDLPSRIPVERMELVRAGGTDAAADESPTRAAAVRFRLSAMPLGARQGQLPEVIEDNLRAGQFIEMAAIGANLQTDAHLAVDVDGHGEQFAALLLQMHQRSICYQPLSSTGLTLFFGNPDARPVHYDYATHFQPTPTPLLAKLEPRQMHAAYQQPVVKSVRNKRMERLMLALAMATAAFLLTAVALSRRTH